MRRLRAQYISMFVLALIGPAAGLAVHNAQRANDEERVRARFASYLATRGDALERELTRVLEQLHALRGLFYASVHVTRDEFASYSRYPLVRDPELQLLAWATLAPVDEGPGPTAESPNGAVRDWSCVVEYIEPSQDRFTDCDLLSDEMWRPVLERAWRTGEVSLSDPLPLFRAGAWRHGFAAALPVYASGRLARSEEELPEGFVLLVLENDFDAAVALSGLTGGETTMDSQIVVPGVDGPFDSRVAAGDAWSRQRPMEVAGSRWLISATPSRAFLRQHESKLALALGLLVFLSTEVVFVALLTIGRATRTRVLGERDRTIREVLENLIEAVVLCDATGRVVYSNDAARGLLGPIADVPAVDWPATFGFFLSDAKTPYPPDRFPLVRAMRGERTLPERTWVRNARHPGGVWLGVTAMPCPRDTGLAHGGIIVLRDITSRMASEASIERLGNAVDQTADMVFTANRDGEIVHGNHAFERMIGCSVEEAVGRRPEDLLLLTEGKKRGTESWVQDVDCTRRRFRECRGPSGDSMSVVETITPMRDETREIVGFVSVCKDITDERERERLEAEMQVAAEVQKRLYPKFPPYVRGLDIAGACFPAESTCGDYFDFLETPDGKIAIVIGDICGHGLGPALMMAETRAYARSLLLAGKPPAEVLAVLNWTLQPDLGDDSFVTLLVAAVDPTCWQVSYASAGHEPALVLDRLGCVKARLANTGAALGLAREMKFECPPAVALEIGDCILFLTDGVTETRNRNGELFGTERALEALRENAGEPSWKIVQLLHDRVVEFHGETSLLDDMTIVCCRMRPTVPRARSWAESARRVIEERAHPEDLPTAGI